MQEYRSDLLSEFAKHCGLRCAHNIVDLGNLVHLIGPREQRVETEEGTQCICMYDVTRLAIS